MDVRLFHVVLTLSFAASAKSQTDSMTVYSDPSAADNSESFHLAGLFPVTRRTAGVCGQVRETGVKQVEGMVFAIRTVNADSSVLPGVNLTFDIRDTCPESHIALENSINYIQSPDTVCTSNVSEKIAVSGVVGPGFSVTSVTTANFFRLFQIPQISHSATASTLSDSTVYDYFFRTIPSDVLQARAMADLIERFNWTYIFALYSDDTYGREGIKSLMQKLKERNDTRRCVALMEALPLSSSATDHNEFYNNLVQEMSVEWVRNASVAVLFGHREEAIALMDAIKRGANTDSSSLTSITWIASDSWAVGLPEKHHDLARGMLSILPLPGNLTAFRDYFVELNPNTSHNPWFAEYWERTFNCSLEDPSCNDGTRNLSHIADAASEPVVTNIVDAVYAFAHALHNMIEENCLNGSICDEITTTRSSVGRAINGETLRDYLFNVSFSSTFSPEPDLLFDSNGDVQGSYLIKNLQISSDNRSSFEVVGKWDHINTLQLTGTIQWNDGNLNPPQSVCSLPCGVGYEPRQVSDQAQCCWTCEPCLGPTLASSGSGCFECTNRTMPNSDKSACREIPVTYFTWSSAWAVVILCLTSIGIIATIFITVIFVVFHRKTVIKASSRELSAFMLTGILLCYAIPFLFVTKPSPAVCGLRRFAIGFCFAIIYAALLVRSNRIHRIFNRPAKQINTPPRFIGSVSQVVIASGLIFVQVLIAAIWLVVERPSTDLKQIDNRTVELRCGENPYFGISISLIYNLLLLSLSMYFAFLTRKVPDNFNEAKYINITLYSLCIIWVGFVPAYYVSVQFGTVYESFFLMLSVISSASATLLCLLVPKVFMIVARKGEEQQKTVTSINATSVDVISSSQL